MMKRLMYAALALAVVGLLGPAQADAQQFPDYRFDIGANVGLTGFTAMLDQSHLGAGADNVRYRAGWLTGASATFWATPELGIRLGGTFTDRPITEGNFFEQGEQLVRVNNLWTGSLDVMFRPWAPNTFMGAEAIPFVAGGLGWAHLNPAGGFVLNPNDPQDQQMRGWFFQPTNSDVFAAAKRQDRFMGLIALGTDVRMADNFALRLEVGDRIFGSPIRTSDTLDRVGNVVHQLYGQVGAHLLMGIAPPPVVAVEPAPPPPPPPPAPAPPAEERIRVCVIDPTAPGGIRMVDAIFLPETRDTLVVVDGQRRALEATLPRVTLARDADWFVRGEPVGVTVAPDLTLEYTTWGDARVIDAADLTYLGNVRNVPVYAATRDIPSNVRQDLQRLRTDMATSDLNVLVRDRADIRRALTETEFLYVPLRGVGCVFQTVRQVEPVIKK